VAIFVATAADWVNQKATMRYCDTGQIPRVFAKMIIIPSSIFDPVGSNGGELGKVG
jgi:hypothetical protein